jgi:hypothetical protein
MVKTKANSVIVGPKQTLNSNLNECTCVHFLKPNNNNTATLASKKRGGTINKIKMNETKTSTRRKTGSVNLQSNIQTNTTKKSRPTSSSSSSSHSDSDLMFKNYLCRTAGGCGCGQVPEEYEEYKEVDD